jgi:hypothetical protein
MGGAERTRSGAALTRNPPVSLKAIGLPDFLRLCSRSRKKTYYDRLGARVPSGFGQVMQTRAPPNIDEAIDTPP